MYAGTKMLTQGSDHPKNENGGERRIALIRSWDEPERAQPSVESRTPENHWHEFSMTMVCGLKGFYQSCSGQSQACSTDPGTDLYDITELANNKSKIRFLVS